TVADTAESLLTFENAALALVVMARDGTVIMANRAMRALLGYEFSEVVGKSVVDLVVGDPAELTQSWDEVLIGPEEVRAEVALVVRRGDGSTLNVRASSVSVTDEHGTVRYIVARAMTDGLSSG